MQYTKLSRSCLALLVFSTVSNAGAKSLSAQEAQSVRHALRALDVDDRVFSDAELSTLNSQGRQEADAKRINFMERLDKGIEVATCGAGTHGGDGDPRPTTNPSFT